MNRKVTRIINWFGITAGALILIIVVMTTIDRLGRTLLGGGMQASIEFCALMLGVLVFLALPYTETRGEHLRMTVVYDRLPTKLRAYVDTFMYLIYAGTLMILVYSSALLAFERQAKGESTWAGAMLLPVWPARFVIAFGATVFFILIILRLVEATKLVIREQTGIKKKE